jgi:hypothetical protein
MFFMLLVAVSVPSFSQDATVNFDQGVSANAMLLTAKEKVKMNGTNVPPSPVPSTGYSNAKNTSEPVHSSGGVTPQLVVLKDLLKDLPVANRSEFIGSIVFSNGHVLSVSSDVLNKKLDAKKISDIVGFIETSGTPAESSDASGISLSKLLNGVPEDIQAEFMDNLVYKKGALVSADIGGLRTVLSEEAITKILDTIYPASGKSMTGTSKTYCDQHNCYSAYCGGSPLTCIGTPNSSHTCGTTCHN